MVNNKTLLIGLEPIINEITNEITNQLTANFTALLNEKIGSPKQTEIMTRKEVSELLQKDYSTLFRWQKKGILLSTNIEGSVFYYRSDINALLEQNKGL